MLSDFLRLIKGFVLFIGPSEAGKTSILRRLVEGKFVEQGPTLGFKEERINKVRVIEIGGQMSFRKYWKISLDQMPTHIFFVIDISKERDFEEYTEFVKEFTTQHSGIINRLSLIANKNDLVDSIPSYLKKTTGLIFSSAKNGEGMLSILEKIASFQNELVNESTILKLEQSDDKEKVENLLKEYQGKF